MLTVDQTPAGGRKIRPFVIPSFFRMLVIDDRIAAKEAERQELCQLFTAQALAAARENSCSTLEVEIVFESDPAHGFRRWYDEPFDLTLIDIDFTRNRDPEIDASDLTKYVLNSREQGQQIFRLFNIQTRENAPYAYRRGMCKYYLWSGLSDQEMDLGANNGAENNNILKKNTDGWKVIIDEIRKIVKNIKEVDFTSVQLLERLWFALRRSDDGFYREMMGGCLIADTENEFVWLPTLIGKKGDNPSSLIRICGAHLPERFFTSSSVNDAIPRFLPLQKRRKFSAVEVIGWLLRGDENRKIADYCQAFKMRAEKTKGLRRPWFPGKEQTEKKPGVQKQLSYIAAATPLTGTTVTGTDRAIESLTEKVKALLQGPFDKVVLKTTYLNQLEQWDRAEWPALHVQSHMRTRCLYPATGTQTLWNSGKTSMETLPPRQLGELLNKLKMIVDTGQVVVSLGSKFPKSGGIAARKYPDYLMDSLRVIWNRLFNEVFTGSDDGFFLVEINVRHFLREIVKYHLGGDEYLTPGALNEKTAADIYSYWREFRLWLAVVHEEAVKKKKKLFLKLSFRSDALAYIDCIVALREHHLLIAKKDEVEYGVRGITVVNALKSPVPRLRAQMSEPVFRSAAWYADPDTWGDASGKRYQMSGRLVGSYRNQLIPSLLAARSRLQEMGLEIWISGGLTDPNEVRHCLSLENGDGMGVITGLQIGTWSLLKTRMNLSAEENWLPDKGQNQVVPVGNKKEKDPITRPIPEKGGNSGKKFRGFNPRFCFLNLHRCNGCGNCSQTFYCDAFLDRVTSGLPPLLDSRFCTGCGLCAQVCSRNALQLYPPGNFLVLLSSSQERREILAALGIPFLAYDPQNDQHNFPKWVMQNLKKAQENDEWEKFWRERVENDCYLFHRDDPELYDDKRLDADRLKSCTETAKKLVDLISEAKKAADYITASAYERSCYWSQLIWSDPGQVLWPCFILAVKMVIESQNGNQNWEISNSVSELSGKIFRVRTQVVLLRAGKILLNQKINSKSYKLVDEFPLNEYDESNFGQGRAAGLDIRACGDGLVQTTEGIDLTVTMKLELAGLPWQQLKEAVEKAEDIDQKDRDDFRQLCEGIV